MEERRPHDPTRRMLRVFGVTVTDYEEKTERIRAALAGATRDDAVRLAAEAIDLTARLNRQLREMTDHLLDAQNGVLADLKAALDRTLSS